MFLNVQFTVQKYNHCFSDKFRVEASVYQENHDVHDVHIMYITVGSLSLVA